VVISMEQWVVIRSMHVVDEHALFFLT
jgi:hypothetical protein